MKHSITLAALLGTFALSGCAVAQNRDYTLELPAGARVKRDPPAWGRTVNGLQLGISLDYLKRPYSLGEVAAFTLEVRNIGKRAVKLTSYKPDWSLSPLVVDGKGKPLSLQQQSLLVGPPYSLPVSPVTVTIAPRQTLVVAQARLTIGLSGKDELHPVLDVVPGKYQVVYAYSFSAAPDEKKASLPHSWVGKLSSGKILLEVAARETKPRAH